MTKWQIGGIFAFCYYNKRTSGGERACLTDSSRLQLIRAGRTMLQKLKAVAHTTSEGNELMCACLHSNHLLHLTWFSILYLGNGTTHSGQVFPPEVNNQDTHQHAHSPAWLDGLSWDFFLIMSSWQLPHTNNMHRYIHWTMGWFTLHVRWTRRWQTSSQWPQTVCNSNFHIYFWYFPFNVFRL